MPPRGIRWVNMRRIHAAHVADARQQLVRREVGRQTHQEQAAVGVGGDRGRLVAREVRVAAVVGREAHQHQVVRVVLGEEAAGGAVGGARVHRVVEGGFGSGVGDGGEVAGCCWAQVA